MLFYNVTSGAGLYLIPVWSWSFGQVAWMCLTGGLINLLLITSTSPFCQWSMNTVKPPLQQEEYVSFSFSDEWGEGGSLLMSQLHHGWAHYLVSPLWSTEKRIVLLTALLRLAKRERMSHVIKMWLNRVWMSNHSTTTRITPYTYHYLLILICIFLSYSLNVQLNIQKG